MFNDWFIPETKRCALRKYIIVMKYNNGGTNIDKFQL